MKENQIMKNNMNKYGFDIKQVEIHKNRVKECFENDLIYRKHNGVRISQMLWAVYFIKVRIIEIGRLQYEYEYTKNNVSIIKIHIPKGKKLNLMEVKDSIKKAETELKIEIHTVSLQFHQCPCSGEHDYHSFFVCITGGCGEIQIFHFFIIYLILKMVKTVLMIL